MGVSSTDMEKSSSLIYYSPEEKKWLPRERSDLYKEEAVCLRGMEKCCRIDEICQNMVHWANYVNPNKGQLNLTTNTLCTVGTK